MRRVVVTGLGILSSIGNNHNDTWSNLIEGVSGINKITTFDTEDLQSKIAGFISHNEDDDFYVNRLNFLEPREIKRNDRFIQYGLIASMMAVENSGILNFSFVKKSIFILSCMLPLAAF